jgi:hypothetical protein
MKDQPYPLTLILRRLKMGEMKEDLEISLNHTSSADGDGSLHSNCVVNVDEDADSVIYILRIAEGVTVKPVDWRRFAYDHKCELRKETSEIYVTIEGEYKNGKRETMAILAGSHLNY